MEETLRARDGEGAPLSPNLRGFINLEALPASSMGFPWKPHSIVTRE